MSDDAMEVKTRTEMIWGCEQSDFLTDQGKMIEIEGEL
jgi:hypothetical protein